MHLTQAHVAEYIHDICRQLEIQARTVGLDTTAYLLNMVVLDTKEAVVIEEVGGAKSSAKAS